MITWLDRRRAARGWDRPFERRLAEWDRGGPELTEAEAARYISGIDPDFTSLGPWLVEIEARTLDGRYDDVLFGVHEQRRARRHRLYIRALLMLIVVVVGGDAYSTVRAKHDAALAAAALARQIAAHELPTADLGRNPVVIATADRDSMIGTLRSDKFIRAHSRYIVGAKWTLFGADGGWLAFDGEMAVHSWAAPFHIATASARLFFRDGRYALRSLAGSDETRVAVDSGTMFVRGILDTVWRDTLHAGDRAIIRRTGQVTVVKTDEGFPSTAFTPPQGSLEHDTVVTRKIRRGFRASVTAVSAVEATKR